jgi:FlaA1/EpsC-like NDP-sugar epimerase
VSDQHEQEPGGGPGRRDHDPEAGMIRLPGRDEAADDLSLTTASGRRIVQAAWDAGAWIIAAPVASYLRYDGQLPDGGLQQALALGALAAVLQVLIGYSLTLYRGRYRVGSFDEVFGLTVTVGIVTALGFIFRIALQAPGAARSVPLIAGALALGLMLGGRFTLRVYRQRFAISKDGARTLVYGAGDSGEQLVEQMLRDPQARYTPVGFLDDDPGKRHLHMHGQRVLGTGKDLETAVSRTGAETLVVAITGVSSPTLLDLDRRCQSLGINLRVIPSTSEIVDGAVKLGDISHVTEEDLLGRRPIETDEAGIREFIEGKRILITGAGGSIGSELARQVHRYAPAAVFLLDRDESGLHSTQLSIDGRGLLTSELLLLADIRDTERMDEVMQMARPDIVFHAAALKHLPLLQMHPEEGRKTNIEGTKNVLQAAHRAGVAAFVNISTDKAADPTSVLGQTKLMTERLTASMAPEPTPYGPSRYLSVRFGNVLGSRGSVLTAFRHQIAHGGPVTVTHPDVTRYFMTIPEAVHLVLQAALIGDHGEVLILDMGEPVRIDDVARQMIEKSGRQIEIVYTGLREGEKLDEVLVSQHESTERRRHALISHTRANPITADQPAFE